MTDDELRGILQVVLVIVMLVAAVWSTDVSSVITNLHVSKRQLLKQAQRCRRTNCQVKQRTIDKKVENVFFLRSGFSRYE